MMRIGFFSLKKSCQKSENCWDGLIYNSSESFITDFQSCDLISLDYDLSYGSGIGKGSDVAEYLSKLEPVCPVILHTSEYVARQAMKECHYRVGRYLF